MIRLYSGEWVKPNHVFSQTQYARASGKDKVVNRVLDGFAVDPAAYLATEFRAIFAIDTNTQKIGDDYVSVACMMECFARFISPDQVTVTFPRSIIAPFKNCQAGQEEKHAWALLVKLAVGSPIHKPGERVAILTDHDLANHGLYKQREIPLYDGIYLPEGFEFVYVSTDTGGHEINRLVMECDRRSTDVLRQLAETGSAAADGATIEIGGIPDLKRR